MGRGIGWGEHWERRGRRGEAVMTPGKWDGGRRSCAQMEERTEAKGLREGMGGVLGKEVGTGRSEAERQTWKDGEKCRQRGAQKEIERK